MKNRRSPLKDKPLRHPGQSLNEYRMDLVFDKVATPFIVTLVLTLVASLEWWYYFRPEARSPWAISIVALIALAYSGWQIRRVLPELERLRLGRDGERAVGEYLDRLREQGYKIFHDIIGDGFNLDHVIIGPTGVYTIETKTLSKPATGTATIDFDGKRVLVLGREMQRNPVIQGKAQASWLKSLLLESTGRVYNVKPVVVFPGWYIDAPPGTQKDMWVLEPKALPAFLSHQDSTLSKDDVRLANYHLSRFVRVNDNN